MKSTTGAGGGEFSGSIGSMTAATSRGRTIFRNKTRPKDRATRRQQESRSIFTGLLNAWTETLTGEQRAGWNNWAAEVLIGGKHLTGQLAFVRTNIPRIAASLPLVQSAPSEFDNGPPIESVSSAFSSARSQIGKFGGVNRLISKAYLQIPAPADGTLLFYISRPFNPTVRFWRGPYQFSFSQFFIHDATSITSIVNAADRKESNGALSIGQTRAVRMVIAWLDGRLSHDFKDVVQVISG